MTRLENKMAKLAIRRDVINSQIYVLENRQFDPDWPLSYEEETCLYYLHHELSDLELTIARLARKS